MNQTISSIELEKIKYGVKARLSNELAGDLSIDAVSEFVTNSIVVQIRGFIWGKQIDRVEIKYPSDWWEAFKERWFPAWALCRWPVRYKIEIVDIKALYPTISDVPGHSRIISVCHNTHLETK